MCLLNKGMHGRRLIDDALAALDLAATPQLETDSAVTLLAHVGTGRWASIIPQTWLRSLAPPFDRPRLSNVRKHVLDIRGAAP
jgi:DNA-binding transcriptional LysR family regulator